MVFLSSHLFGESWQQKFWKMSWATDSDICVLSCCPYGTFQENVWTSVHMWKQPWRFLMKGHFGNGPWFGSGFWFSVPGSPSFLNVLNPGLDSLTLEWGPPTNNNGRLAGFTLKYQPGSLTNCRRTTCTRQQYYAQFAEKKMKYCAFLTLSMQSTPPMNWDQSRSWRSWPTRPRSPWAAWTPACSTSFT